MSLEAFEIGGRRQGRRGTMAGYGNIRDVVAVVQSSDPRVLGSKGFPVVLRHKHGIVNAVNLSPVATADDAQVRYEGQTEEATLQMPDHARVIGFEFFVFNPIHDVALLGGPIGLSSKSGALFARALGHSCEDNCFIAVPNHARIKNANDFPIRMRGRHILGAKQEMSSETLNHWIQVLHAEILVTVVSRRLSYGAPIGRPRRPSLPNRVHWFPWFCDYGCDRESMRPDLPSVRAPIRNRR